MGNTIGSIVQVADPEDDGEGGEFLRIRVTIDVTKALPRCCKLWFDSEHVGWALLQFEQLPNFCYWCDRVTYSERDCEVWIQWKGRLEKEDQQYGEWLCANPVRHTRKTVVVVSGSSRGAPLWKKGPTMEKRQPITKELSDQGGSVLNFGKWL